MGFSFFWLAVGFNNFHKDFKRWFDDFFKGNGVIELWSNTKVNDGGWHNVQAQFNPSYLEVTVDGHKKSHRPELRENQHIDLNGLMYFGGMETMKKSRAAMQGVAAAQALPLRTWMSLSKDMMRTTLERSRIQIHHYHEIIIYFQTYYRFIII